MASLALAEVSLPALFSDHMVLQRGAAVSIWGNAEPGEEVTLTIDSSKGNTTTGPDGHWSVALDLTDLSDGPHCLIVKGDNSLRIEDVMVGEVWLASGQSNMEFALRRSIGGAAEVEKGCLGVREFRVPHRESDTPMTGCEGKWVVAAPGAAGDFSAVGYWFAKDVYEATGKTVGIVNTSYAGTPIEAWISPEGFTEDEELNADQTRVHKEQAAALRAKADYVEAFEEWLKQTGRQDRVAQSPDTFNGPTIDPEEWVTVEIPGKISDSRLPKTGVIWLRKEITIPEAEEGKPLPINMGSILGFDEIFYNGVRHAKTTYTNLTTMEQPRINNVAGFRVKPGKAVFAVRIYAPYAEPEITTSGKLKLGNHDLSGKWLARAEYSFDGLPEVEAPAPPTTKPRRAQDIASALYNGMINPVTPLCVRGVLWYQGEQNAGRADQYRRAFPLLITDWREKWGRPDLPFYFCQLPNFRSKDSTPRSSDWAELREAQSLALELPNTGEAVLIDLGEAGDVHPRNKQAVGERLARIALARDYGMEVVDEGPTFNGMTVEGGAIRIHFTNTDGGLVARELPSVFFPKSNSPKTLPLERNAPYGDVEGFALCGKDGKWAWAGAQIEGDEVVVSSPSVPHPTAVRYAWGNNPTCNLYNGAGLPASPFRTDDFPLITRHAHY